MRVGEGDWTEKADDGIGQLGRKQRHYRTVEEEAVIGLVRNNKREKERGRKKSKN